MLAHDAGLASAERRAYYHSNGTPNIGLGIIKTSTANALDVARAARAMAAEIQKSLPEGTNIFVAFDDTVRGWASMVVIVLFLGGAQLLSLGLLGEYLGRLYAAVQGRPSYFIASDTAISPARDETFSPTGGPRRPVP